MILVAGSSAVGRNTVRRMRWTKFAQGGIAFDFLIGQIFCMGALVHISDTAPSTHVDNWSGWYGEFYRGIRTKLEAWILGCRWVPDLYMFSCPEPRSSTCSWRSMSEKLKKLTHTRIRCVQHLTRSPLRIFALLWSRIFVHVSSIVPFCSFSEFHLIVRQPWVMAPILWGRQLRPM